jgi:tetratricopeptide (TPR) repeat protein
MRPNALGHLVAATIIVLAGVASAGEEPIFENLGSIHRTVTTSSDEAQRYFDQGLTLYFGFNHEEATRSFEAAATLDPDCAMAYWGIAVAAGPNINNPEMDEETSRAAYKAAQHALTLIDGCTDAERALIDAVAARYAPEPPEDRTHLNQAYADAMAGAWEAHPDDADVGALYAESLMDLRPWDLWTPDGEPQPGTLDVVAVLERVLELAPMHAGANHFYIHTMEASPTPEKAVPSADRMRDLVPGAGHLVHMPAHIDIRLGHYDNAIKANQKAIEADLAYIQEVGRGGFYTLYRAHNYHFLAYAAMFDGRRGLAMKAARDMIGEISLELVRAYPDFLDGFIAVPYHVMVRFGLWNDILNEEKPPEDLVATIAFWHYARTVALSVLGRTDEATKEFALLKQAYEQVPESRTIGNNPARVVLDIGLPMAEGELEYRKGNTDRAFELLREAVRRDDELRYDEPWGWMQPARHALGALLVEQGKYDEAEAVYREDLRIHPKNGWALHGLAECLRKTGREKESEEVDAAYRQSWARSDIRIKGSCYCRTKT